MSLAGALGNAELPDSAERIAQLDGVHVVFVPLDTPETDRVRKQEAAAAARLIAEQLGDDLLLIFANTSATQLHLIHPRFERGVILRRMVVERDLPRRTAVQQVANIYWSHRKKAAIRAALDEAFDVEPVTKAFFAEYKRIFEAAEESVSGFGDGGEEQEDRRLFVQTLFNRLMFVYFLSRKGWLTFQGNKDYLNALWRDYKDKPDQTNFYDDRLRHLFFFGLNNPQSRDLNSNFKGSVVESIFGEVPFLNGGLFEKTDLDKRSDVTVPDSAIEQVLRDLFDKFNFTVMESTPFDIEVAVDPEMLGKVFEELVTGRHESGSYYTPRPVVSFMCREALKGYLEAQGTGLTAEAVTDFVEHQRTDGIPVADARKVAKALERVTVVDPAADSGAYLLGMMQELVDPQTVLYHAIADPRSIYALKLEIIQRNLYGVDIDEFAVNIAMLRMWLSLAIDYEGDKPEPLPNLDFKVVCGDSLLGPNPSAGVIARNDVGAQVALGREPERMREFDRLKADYMHAARAEEKARLRTQIDGIRDRLREALGDATAVPDGSVDWRVEFAEAFADRGGFDIAIANPPYVDSTTMTKRDPQERKKLAAQYATATGNWDYYIPFWERCLELTRTRGVVVLITPNKWLSAPYGKGLRSSTNQKVSVIADLSKFRVFWSAGVFPVIVIAKEAGLNSAVKVLKFSDYTTIASTINVSRSAFAGLTNWGVALSNHAKELLLWMESCQPLSEICTVHGSFTVKEAYELTELIQDHHEEQEQCFRLINTGTIDPFCSLCGKRKTRYLGNNYDRPSVFKKKFASEIPKRYSQTTSPKIVVGGIGDLEAFFDEHGTYIAGKSTIVLRDWNQEISPWFLLAILNSEAVRFFYS